MTTNTSIIIIIERKGSIKELKVKNLQEEDLYKKAGFKTKEYFEQRQVWKNIQCNSKIYENIVVYGKIKGNAGKENKYEFPPPIDTTLYFGNMVIVYYDEHFQPQSLSSIEWKSIYNGLMGGFESLDESSNDEEEDEYIDPSKLDKYGYEKDGFVVEDDDEEEFDCDSELSEEKYFD